MSYSGGLGAGKGWYSFKFILSPDEFESIFNKLSYSFIEANKRAELDYTETNKLSFFSNYRIFYNKIISGECWDKKVDWAIESSMRISIADDIKKISFKEFSIKEKGNLNSYKLVIPTEPLINIHPFFLSLLNETLSLETFNVIGILGIQFSYPKVISWEHENHQHLHDTQRFKTKELFNTLTHLIKDSSRKAKLSGPSKIYRPNFWVNENCLNDVNNNYYLKTNFLKIY